MLNSIKKHYAFLLINSITLNCGKIKAREKKVLLWQKCNTIVIVAKLRQNFFNNFF